MNKITFCSYPDIVEHTQSYGLRNFDNHTVKQLLNSIDQDTVFYLIDDQTPNEWLNNVTKKVKIIFDCAKVSLDQIQTVCQKK